ncbi:MAG TPA: ABC transporter permease, partial [Anaerolineae bacterium]|nr:ABC transporter permease [Anaerolineae bacterium]
MKVLLTLALRYLLARRMRSALTTLAIVLGVAIIFGLNGLVPAIKDAFQKNLADMDDQADLVITAETHGPFDAGLVDRVESVPGISHATGVLGRSVALPAAQAPHSQSGLPLGSILLIGLDPERVSLVRPLSVVEGRPLEPGDEAAVVISTTLAEKTGLAPGDILVVPSASGSLSLEIVGLVNAPPAPGVDEVYVSLATSQALFNLPGQLNAVEAAFAPGSDPELTSQAVLESLGPGFKTGGTRAGSELLAMSEMVGPMLSLFGVLALVMGGFIIFNTFRTAVVERRRDIGMLRAVGATRRTIVGLVLFESLLQGVAGTAAGMIAGYLLVVVMLAAANPIWEEYMRFPLGQPSFSLPVY